MISMVPPSLRILGVRAAPCRSAVALPVGATSNGSSSESRLCAKHERLGPDDCENLEPAIIVREPDGTMQPTPQDNRLMSKHRVFSLKPQLRLEWRGQDGQNETEQPDHSASLGDSITSSTRIRFSVRTGGRLYAADRTEKFWGETEIAALLSVAPKEIKMALILAL